MAQTPFRLLVLQKLTEVMERATLDGQALTGAVFRGKSLYGDDDPLPMISILEPPIPVDVLYQRAENPKSAGNWDLLIQGFVPDDPHNPSDPAHKLMASVKMLLAAEKKRGITAARRTPDLLGLGAPRPTGNCVSELTIGQGAVRSSDEASTKCYFWLTLTLMLTENLDQPFEEV